MRRFSLLLLVFMTLVLCVWTMANEPAKWTPQYGEKGDLLNPERSVTIQRQTQPSEYPVTTDETLELFEDFNNWGPYGDNPPSGWTILDSGFVPTWDNNDWMKYYSSSWTNYARAYYYPNYENNDEWIISPTVDFTGATACSLSFSCYYNDYTGDRDTLYILGSTDGVNWTAIDTWFGSDRGSSTSKLTSWVSYDITSIADEQTTFRVAFRWVDRSASTGGYVYLDDVLLYKDASTSGDSLMFEDFESDWGPLGDNPPAGWTIIDNGDYDYSPVWNNNDWHKYYYSTWADTIARVYYSPAEYPQNEWLISPAMDFSSSTYDQVMLKFKHYYNDGAGEDTGWVKVYDGSTWSDVVMYNADSPNPEYAEFDITSLVGTNSGVQVAFKYVGVSDWYWYVDSVQVVGVTLAADDVLTSSINSPTLGIEGYNWDVNVTVYNNGTANATFQDSTFITAINKTQFFYENFSTPQSWNGGNPPTNVAGTWAVLDSGSANDGWNNNDWHAYYYSSWGDTVARVYYSPSEVMNEWLITPAIDGSGYSNIHLSFNTFFNWEGTTDTAYILGTTNDWATTYELARWATDHGNYGDFAHEDFDISSWADGSSTIKIAFKYVGNYDLYWYVDDVELYSASYTNVYTSAETVTDLTSLESRDISYAATWNDPDPGDYLVTSFTALTTDSDLSNDTLTNQITSYPHFGSGGPDIGYYIWEDNITGTGDAFSWIDITGIGTPATLDLGSADDRYSSAIDMGISYYFYGASYDSIYIHENGVLTFYLETGSTVTNYGIPSSSGPENMIAMLWDDLSGVDSGTVYTYSNSVDTFIVTFENWDFYTDTNQRIDMQAILCSSTNTIKLQYQTIGPVVYVSHTIGIENADYSSGLQYVYNTNPIGNIALPGLAITFSYDPPQIDGSLASVDVPYDGEVLLLGETVTPAVTIAALGEDSLQAQVTLKIFDELATEVYNQTETSAWVPGLSSVQHAFATDFTPASEGTYDVEAFVVVTSDANTANDTLLTDFDVFEHYSTGGPDAYGYRYVDNISVGSALEVPAPPTFSYVDISTTGDTLRSGDDNYAGPFALGFNFDFYDTNYTEFWISTNGLISFESITTSYSSNYCPLPYSSAPYKAIYPFWDDMNLRSVDNAMIYGQYFDADVDYYVIQFYNISRYTYYGAPMDFEVILYADGRILFQYLRTNDLNYGHGQSATVGIENNTLTSGLSYECNGSPGGNPLVDSLAVLFFFYEPAIDAIMESVDAPVGGSVGEETFPAVTVFNNGQTATSVNVNFTITDESLVEVYNQTEATASIDPGTSLQHVFTTGWTPATAGVYATAANADLTGDEFPDNNDASGSCTIYDAYIDFETDDGGFAATNDWEYGTPTGDGPGGAYSGLYCWGTILDGSDPTPSTASDLSFNVDVTGGTPSVTFYQWYEGSTISYYFRVIVNDSTIDEWQGSNTNWLPYTIDLTGYTGIVNITLEMEIGTYLAYEGWYVDDFGFVGCAVVPAVSIYDIQYATEVGNACYESAYHGDIIQTNGIVTGIMQGTYNNYFIQDCGFTDFNGVYVYDATQTGMAIGDDVTFIAEVDEYSGLTELKNVVGLVTNSTGNAVCTLSVSSDDVGRVCDTLTAVGENLEGMLVMLENAECVVGPDSYNVSYVKTPGAVDSCALDDDLYRYGGDQPAAFVVGETYNIVGLAYYSYGIYKVLPRFAADVTEATAEFFGTVTDAGENPLQDVVVSLYDDGDVLIDTDNTDVNGEYSIVIADFGNFRLEFTKGGYYDAGEFDIDAAAGDQIQVDMVMHTPASYSGTVTDETPVPLENVHVWVEAPAALAADINIPVAQPQRSAEPFNKDMSNTGDLISGKDIKQALGSDNLPMVETEYCRIIPGGPDYIGAYMAIEGNGEVWTIFEDPGDCGLAQTYPFMVSAARIIIQSGDSTQEVNFYIEVYEADMSDTCPVPGALLYQSQLYTDTCVSGYIHGFYKQINTIVNGPYFIAMEIVSDHAADPLGWGVSSQAATPCLAYVGDGVDWLDLADYFAFDPVVYFFSEGYSTEDGTLITEDWTDAAGAYELVLHPGVYNIFYALDGFDTVMVEAVVLAIDEVSTGNDVVMVTSGYAYLPGDANMVNGVWPAQVIGSDVTFLVNYFRGLQPGCELDGFFASGDANGDCSVIGSDVTRLVSYFRGLQPVEWCGAEETDPLSYPPLWLTEDDLPETAPDGWPNCDPIPEVTGTRTIPSGSVK